MPLYINDPETDRLAEELVGITKTSKVDAVKTALKREIASRKKSLPICMTLSSFRQMSLTASSGIDSGCCRNVITSSTAEVTV